MRPTWWQNPKTHASLEDTIARVGGSDYELDISPINPLGATSHTLKKVLINPTAISYPKQISKRKLIRYAPSGKTQWQKKLTMAVAYHEAAHICYSDEKPSQPLLGWLWNALEDGRIEKLLGNTAWHIKRLFNFIGDAVWSDLEATSELLSGCLLWRWEWQYPADSRKFIPSSPSAQKLWEEEIRPLVEEAWDADNSDLVTEIAEKILLKLNISVNTPLPTWLPVLFWEAPTGNPNKDSLVDVIKQALEIFDLFEDDDDEDYEESEDDPEPLLQSVEGLATNLAEVLKIPSPSLLFKHDRSKGYFNADRFVAGSDRPFDRKHDEGEPYSTAILLLVDQSGSMEGEAIAKARTIAMLLERVASIADNVTLGIWGFGDSDEPYVHRPLSMGTDLLAQRRIAGMQAWTWGTVLSPVFQKATQALSKREERWKLLIVFTDAELELEDARLVSKEVQDLGRSHIHLQPIFVGNSSNDAKAANIKVFGHIMACDNFDELLPYLSSWLQALLRG